MLEMLKIQIAYLRTLRQDGRAVTALEYGMIASVMGGVVIFGLSVYKSKMKAMFDAISASLTLT